MRPSHTTYLIAFVCATVGLIGFRGVPGSPGDPNRVAPNSAAEMRSRERRARSA